MVDKNASEMLPSSKACTPTLTTSSMTEDYSKERNLQMDEQSSAQNVKQEVDLATRIKEEPHVMDLDEEPKSPQLLRPEVSEDADEHRMHEIPAEGAFVHDSERCQLSPSLEQLGAHQADAAEHSLMKMQMRKYI